MHDIQKKQNVLQKLSIVSGIISFILAIVCAVALFIKGNELGMNHPIPASLLASIFFFFFVGGVLFVIGKADIPSFKIIIEDQADSHTDSQDSSTSNR